MNFVILSNGTLMAAGDGMHIGKNNSIPYGEFIKVTNEKFSSFSVGSDFAFFINRIGRLKYIGYNSYILLPSNSFILATNYNSIKVSSGFYHALFIRNDFSLYSVGQNNYGQLGLGNTTDYQSFQKIGSDSWVDCDAGLFHSAGITYGGTLYTWGNNSGGELGLGDTNQRTSPVVVPGGYRWRQVSCGNGFTLAIKDDFSLFGCGAYSRIGSGAPGYSTSFVQLIGGKWKYISCGSGYSIGIKTDGTMWAWGSNNYGQLGNGTYGSSIQITPVQIGVDKKWVFCKASKRATPYSIAITDSGELYVWGSNQSGQLGINYQGDTGILTTPTYAISDCLIERGIV